MVGGQRGERNSRGYIVGGTSLLLASADGLSWQQPDLPRSVGPIGSVHYAGGSWFAFGAEGSLVSADGGAWVEAPAVPGRVAELLFGQGRWVARSTSGIFYSESGRDWRLSLNGDSLDADYGGGLWIVARDASSSGNDSGGGVLYASSDLNSWRSVYVSPEKVLRSVGYADFTWLALGDGGLLVRSQMGPTLEPAWTPGQLRLSWDAKASDFILEHSSTVDTEFVPVGSMPSVQEDRATVDVPLNEGSQFFRLRRP